MVSGMRALSELGDFAADAINGATVSFISWYRDGSLLTANPKFFELTGYSQEEVEKMRWPADFTTPSFCSDIHAAMDVLQGGGEAYEHEGELVRKDRSHVPVRVFVHVHRQLVGQDWYYSFITDISRQVEDRITIRKAKDQAELYMDILTHDIRNMTQLGIGYLEIGLEKMKAEGKITERHILEKPLDALDSTIRIIENVKTLRMVQTGRFGQETVDICAVLSEVVRRFSHLPGRDVRISYVPGKECRVYANPLVGEIFLNIVGNSIKHSPHEKPLAVNITQRPAIEGDRNYLAISVEDNGPGIPDDMKKQLFARFTPDQPESMKKGLGLYIVKTLVDSYGGKVQVEDRVQGDHTLGTRFIVWLPAA